MTAVMLGIVVGLVLGLTGAGGSILAVPLLVVGLGLNLMQATPIALLAVFGATAFGALAALRAGQVCHRAALMIGELRTSSWKVAVRAQEVTSQNVIGRRWAHRRGGTCTRTSWSGSTAALPHGSACAKRCGWQRCRMRPCKSRNPSRRAKPSWGSWPHVAWIAALLSLVAAALVLWSTSASGQTRRGEQAMNEIMSLSQMRRLAIGHRYSVDIEVIQRLEALSLPDLMAAADVVSRKSRSVSARVPQQPDGLSETTK